MIRFYYRKIRPILFFWQYKDPGSLYSPYRDVFMTLPNYPQVDTNITCHSADQGDGAFQLLPFCGKDVHFD